MFKSGNVGVAWVGSTLKTFKVYIKIVKQHASKRRPSEGIDASDFCCLTGNKFKEEEFNTKETGIGWTQTSSLQLLRHCGEVRNPVREERCLRGYRIFNQYCQFSCGRGARLSWSL